MAYLLAITESSWKIIYAFRVNGRGERIYYGEEI
jgi:hypothetical protein